MNKDQKSFSLTVEWQYLKDENVRLIFLLFLFVAFCWLGSLKLFDAQLKLKIYDFLVACVRNHWSQDGHISSLTSCLCVWGRTIHHIQIYIFHPVTTLKWHFCWLNVNQCKITDSSEHLLRWFGKDNINWVSFNLLNIQIYLVSAGYLFSMWYNIICLFVRHSPIEMQECSLERLIKFKVVVNESLSHSISKSLLHLIKLWVCEATKYFGPGRRTDKQILIHGKKECRRNITWNKVIMLIRGSENIFV